MEQFYHTLIRPGCGFSEGGGCATMRQTRVRKRKGTGERNENRDEPTLLVYPTKCHSKYYIHDIFLNF
jgi:hypothetical protein